MEPFDISSNHRIIDVIIRAPRNIPFRDGLLFFIVLTSIDLSLLSSPRAKHAGPKGLHAESARAFTGRRCPHSGEGEDFLRRQPDFFYENCCISGTESRKIVPKVGNERPLRGLQMGP